MAEEKWMAGFEELTAKNHIEQAKWWLNAFWADGAEEYAEDVWKCTQLMIELDMGTVIRRKGKDDAEGMGCDIDEFKSHQFLERLGETLTVVALRRRLKDLDIDNNKRLCLSEYFLSKYEKTPDVLVNAPQGDNAEQVAAAEEMMKKVSEELSELTAKLEMQKRAVDAAAEQKELAERALAESEAAKQAAEEALEAAHAAEASAKSDVESATATREASDVALAHSTEAKKVSDSALEHQREEEAKAQAAHQASIEAEKNAEVALEEQKVAEKVVRDAEAELQKAVDDLKRQEDEYHGKIAMLEAKGEDSTLGVVTRNKAKNEVAQLKSEDPLPLRRAKITQEAALKRVQKERKKAEAVTEIANGKVAEASTAREAADVAVKASEEATREAEVKLHEATSAEAAASAAARQAAAAQKKSEESHEAAVQARAASAAKADQATASAEASRVAAEHAAKSLEVCVDAAAEVAAAVTETEAALAEAEAELGRVKKGSGVPLGSIWFMEREIIEAKKYLPQRKQ